MAERSSGRGGGSRGKRPTAVGEALRSYLAKSGLAARLAQAQVIPDWPGLVGPQIARVTAPESVRPRRLSDQDDPLASLTVEGYGEGKTPSIEGQG